MLKSGENLILGVAPVEIPDDDPNAAYEGRRGGSVWVCSTEDGNRVFECKLDAPTVWDGLAAANGKLFLSAVDGSVCCLAGVP